MTTNDADRIVDSYIGMVKGIGVEVYVRVEESGLVHLFTVLDRDFRAEPFVYEAEQNVLKMFGAERVTFDVYPDLSPIEQQPKDSISLVLAA